MDTPGVVRGKRIEKIGMQSSDTAQLFFEDVRVPKKNIIGQEGKGFIYQMQQFQQERIYCVAITLKALELVINETIDVSRFCRPLYRSKISLVTAETGIYGRLPKFRGPENLDLGPSSSDRLVLIRGSMR